ncbi:MAG: hypothetical protein GY795_26955 [Desulfobacterales bacterium]|nr:hypothetical protein [Desulfobacterales bacterium]
MLIILILSYTQSLQMMNWDYRDFGDYRENPPIPEIPHNPSSDYIENNRKKNL